MEKEILTVDNVILNSKPKDKWEAIRLCGQILVDNGYVKPDYIQDMYDREKLSSVYIGNEIAIPHGLDHSDSNIYESGLSVVQIPEGIQFEEQDANTKAYVLIGIAGKNNTHLDILGKIAIICSDPASVEMIKKSQDKQQIVNLLKDIKEL